MKSIKRRISAYMRAQRQLSSALNEIARMEAALFVPGVEVRWEHGDNLRLGEVLRHNPGILDAGSVLVRSRSGREQFVRCSRVLLDYMR